MNLKKTTLFNTLSSWLDTLTKILIELFTKPIVVGLLGSNLFGIWQVLNQLNSYMGTVDLRTGTSLKWFISRNRTTVEDSEIRKTFSAALISNLLFLPIYIIIGIALIWISPQILKASSDQVNLIRLTTSFLVLGFIIDQYSFMLQSVIVGMNLTYKKFGIRSLMVILNGFMVILLLKLGFSLPTLAILSIFVSLANGLIYFWILKTYVNWFGFERPTRASIFDFFLLTSRFLFLKVVDILNDSSDLILLGFFAGSEYVTIYVISKYLILGLSQIGTVAMTAIVPSFSIFVGENKLDKVVTVRNYLINFNWYFLTIIGLNVIFFNKQFVKLWTEESMFIGSVENVLLVVIVILKNVQSVDASIIATTLKIKEKIMATLCSAIVTILVASLLIAEYKILGLLIALLIGSLISTFSFAILAQKKMNSKKFLSELFSFRKLLVLLIFFLAALKVELFYEINSWLLLIFSMLIATLIFVPIYFYLGLRKNEQSFLLDNTFKYFR